LCLSVVVPVYLVESFTNHYALLLRLPKRWDLSGTIKKK
jgi:hypothetical protein